MDGTRKAREPSQRGKVQLARSARRRTGMAVGGRQGIAVAGHLEDALGGREAEGLEGGHLVA